MDISRLKVEHYTERRIPNPNPDGDLPWYVYQGVRNAVVRCCRLHGPTGPLGILPIDSISPRFDVLSWERGDPDPWYYIIDDQYNHERYLYGELYGPEPFTMSWLSDLTETLHDFPGWGLCVSNISKGYVIIFERKLMVHGEPFKACKSATEVKEAASQELASHPL